MRHLPQSARATDVFAWDRGQLERRLDELAAEEPLEIRINGKPISITMRTPGHDFDLAAGFLLTEGVITRREDLARIAYGVGPDGQTSGNIVDVTLAPGVTIDRPDLERHFAATSSCGICGRASIEALQARDIARPDPALTLDPRILTTLPGKLRGEQAVFDRTGGLHAAALFDLSGSLLTVREDIGRHNTVDKIVGEALLGGHLPLKENVLLVSGRGGFEIVQKALVAGVPVLAAVSAPSSLAVQLARDYGLSLIGFLREERFIVYSGESRLRAVPQRSP